MLAFLFLELPEYTLVLTVLESTPLLKRVWIEEAFSSSNKRFISHSKPWKSANGVRYCVLLLTFNET